jgi:hypothetical protein
VSNRSLDEFASAARESAADDESDADEGAATSADDDAATGADDPTPSTPTARWSPDGVCPDCGVDAPYRWRESDRFVCADCAEW